VGKKKETRKENIMKKALLSAACLGTTVVFAQVKDTLQTKNVDEVVMTASRKKKVSKRSQVLLLL
jgi:iron complex outermembrane receptor protein